MAAVQLWTSLLPAIYSVSIVITSPLAGYLSDNSKRRKPVFLWGLVFQAAGVGLLTAGTSLGLWIPGMIIAGMSSGAVWTSCLAFTVEVTESKGLAEKLGIINISLSCGLLLGTILGGIVYAKGGYYAVWAMVYALIAVDACLRLAMIEPSAAEESPTNEAVSSAKETVPEDPPSSRAKPWTLSPSILLWRSPRFTAMICATALDATLLTSFDGALAIHLQGIFQYGTLGVGLTYMSLVLPTFLAPLMGRLADRTGARWVLTTALALGTIPLVCLRYVNHDSTSQKVLICALLFLVGVTASGRLSIYSAQVNHAVLEYAQARPESVSHDRAIAQAQGIWTAAYSTGCALGPIYGGLVQGKAGWETETWAVAVLSAVTAFVTFTFASSSGE